MEITDNVYSSVKSYFTALSQLGYKDYDSVYKLLVYTFIEEILTGAMRFFITEEDYRIIEEALSCIYGTTCLMPYPQYINEDSLFGQMESIGYILPRITEDTDNIRVLESEGVRFKASGYNE